MSISQKLKKYHKNQIENIKIEKNHSSKNGNENISFSKEKKKQKNEIKNKIKAILTGEQAIKAAGAKSNE